MAPRRGTWLPTAIMGVASMARWKVEKDYAVTECEADHPMRLPRHPEQPNWTDRSERAEAIRAGKAGYLCPAGSEHWYPMWVVVDTASKDSLRRDDIVFDNYRDAVAYRDRVYATPEPAQEPLGADEATRVPQTAPSASTGRTEASPGTSA